MFFWSGNELALNMSKRDARRLTGGKLVGRAECMDDSTRWIPLFFCFLLATHFFICYNFLYSPRKGRKGLGIGGIWSGYHGGALRHWGIETLRHFLFSFLFLLLFSPSFFFYFLLAFPLPLETPGTKSPTKHLKKPITKHTKKEEWNLGNKEAIT